MPRALFAAALLALAAALPSAVVAATPVRPPLEGLWDTPGGRVELRVKRGKVSGVLTSPAEGVVIAAGTKVLEGMFFEDNLSADIRLGVVVPGCADAPGKAFAVLLLTKKGKLTGGVSSRAACAKSASAVAFLRSTDQGTSARTAHGTVGDAPQAGSYDPHGQRTAPLPASVAELMADAAGHLNEGRFEEARKQFLAAIKKDPTIGEAYNGVGVTYYARNDFEQAIDWYKNGLEATPGFGDLYYNLACAYSLLGKKPMALRYLKLAAAKGYTELEALDKDTDLTTLREEAEFLEIRSAMETPAAPLPP